MPDGEIPHADIGDILRQVLGAGGVSDDAAKRALFSQDVWISGETATVVASPTTVEQTAAAVGAATARGYAIAIRGAGMSYTKGYIPVEPRTVLLDMSKMDKVVSVSPEDMTVTVQAGCTWETLKRALKPHGLRTPFWGPLSGLKSTIGGGISHYNAIFGAGHYGTSSESVVAMTVVLADGRILHTGARRPGADGAQTGDAFYRFYGPDLTGLFTGDCGVFGVKAELTLRLIRDPEFKEEGSFVFPDYKSWIEGTAEIARAGVAAEMFGFDPQVAGLRMKRSSLAADVKTLGKVVSAGGSLLQGMKDAAKIVTAGRDFIGADDYSLHVFCENRSKTGAAEDIAAVRAIVKAVGGREVEASIARVIRAEPFPALNSVLGPTGERWVPVHGHVAMSDAVAAFEAIEKVMADRAAVFERLKIDTGYLVTALSTNAFTIEPVFFWPEAREPIHETTVDPDFLSKLPPPSAPNPEATAAVAEARQAVIDAFQPFGAVHHQIGRTYPFLEKRDAPSQELLRSLKAALDPHRRLNPGGLGL